MVLSGCLFTYLVKSGYNQMSLLSDREPIEKVLKQQNLSPEHRHKLELALQIRDFAQNKLKLKQTDNYKTYVDIRRPYVTYIVTVAEKWQLEPRLYWYPLVGNLPYKGFFKKEEADEEAKKFDPQKYDVMVRGVSAYSTLGWFDDPLLSSMLDGEDHDLVNLILHESTHATLYFKSQADFNERLATYVGNVGTEIYYREKEGLQAPTLKKIADENRDEKIFSEFISHEIKTLKEWYKSQTVQSEEARNQRIAEIQKKFTSDIAPTLRTKNYINFPKMNLNNAVLLYFNTYVFDLTDFDKLYRHFNENFSDFLSYCRSLEKNPDPQKAIKEIVKTNVSSSN